MVETGRHRTANAQTPATAAATTGVRPFLKWPGGKYRLVSRIRAALGPGKRLIEPFVGSAAVFLNTDYDAYLLADSNSDLINLYSHLREEGQTFIDDCQDLFDTEHNLAKTYYALRDEFNGSRDRRRKSVLFVYLNRHCYNGLCRYNASGGFNTPFGRYTKPSFPEQRMQVFAGHGSNTEFIHADFLDTMRRARKGDVVYCDPPYQPLSRTASFTAYATGTFGWEEQVALADAARKAAKRGAQVVISNHDTPEIRALYQGARIENFPVWRSISRDIHNRNDVGELLAVF